MTVKRYPCKVDDRDSLTVDTDGPDEVRLTMAEYSLENTDVWLDTANAAELHRQLGRWLGTNPTGLVDTCPGSGQPPATHVPRARQGTCSTCGDRFMVTSRGLVYKHRRRP